MVIRNLTGSYRRQVAWYADLESVVGKILGRLILSRGDFAGVKADFEEKQRLLDRIEQERRDTVRDREIWRMRKNALSGEKEACEFDEVLLHAEVVIKKFLEAEGQLQRYVEQRMRQEHVPAVQGYQGNGL